MWEDRGKLSCVFLLSDVDKHVQMQSYILRSVGATDYFKWFFNLFEINVSTVKMLH